MAESLRTALLGLPAYQQWVSDIDIAGPGFINIRLKTAAKQAVVHEVLAAGNTYGQQTSNGQRVLVEFVSANPTGPLHVGHGRQAALGDSLCRLFETQGFNVTREFYYNDAGVQINTLDSMVFLNRPIEQRDFPDPARMSRKDRIQQLILQRGLMFQRCEIDWAQALLHALEQP